MTLAAPSNFGARADSRTSIKLDWTDNSSPPANESGFKVERCQGTTTTCGQNPSSFVEVAQTATNVRILTDTGLTPNTTYTYRVRGVNASGHSSYSNMASAKTKH